MNDCMCNVEGGCANKSLSTLLLSDSLEIIEVNVP